MPKQKLKSYKVFKPAGFPIHTYVKRQHEDEDSLEEILKQATYFNKLITLTGPTKSGKTVLVNKVFPRFNPPNVWVDGGSVRKDEEKFWSLVLNQIGGATEVEHVTSTGSDRTSGVETGVKGKVPLLAEGNAKFSHEQGSNKSEALKIGTHYSSKVAAITKLQSSLNPLIIDDFHFLDYEVRRSVIEALKPLIMLGTPAIVISIPQRKHDVSRVRTEMDGRVEPVQIPDWRKDELIKIPKLGLPLLNVTFSEEVCNQLVRECFKSPHLMQELCLRILLSHRIVETSEEQLVIDKVDQSIFKQVAKNTGAAIYRQLVELSDAEDLEYDEPYVLKDNTRVNLHELILRAISITEAPNGTLSLKRLNAAIRTIVISEIPDEVAVLDTLSILRKVRVSEESSIAIIDWEDNANLIHLTDPLFYFYLRWHIAR